MAFSFAGFRVSSLQVTLRRVSHLMARGNTGGSVTKQVKKTLIPVRVKTTSSLVTKTNHKREL